MTSASLFLASALLLGPPASDPGADPSEAPTPVLTPTQPQPGEPAIAPARIEGERAVTEPEPTQPNDPPIPELEPEPEPSAGELPSWQETPDPSAEPGGDTQATPIADWTTPVDPTLVAPVESPQAPPKGAALIGPAVGMFGAMIVTQAISGMTCEQDVYCGTRGWPWRFMGFATVGLAGGGGWLHGKRMAWDRAHAGEPAKNPIGRRAAGWTLFIVGVGGMIADTALYQLCYDGARGPYIDITGFTYTCSPNLSVVTLDISTLLSATGLGLALSAESQLRHRPKFDLSVAPWGGRGQAGLSIGGRF